MPPAIRRRQHVRAVAGPDAPRSPVPATAAPAFHGSDGFHRLLIACAARGGGQLTVPALPVKPLCGAGCSSALVRRRRPDSQAWSRTWSGLCCMALQRHHGNLRIAITDEVEPRPSRTALASANRRPRSAPAGWIAFTASADCPRQWKRPGTKAAFRWRRADAGGLDNGLAGRRSLADVRPEGPGAKAAALPRAGGRAAGRTQPGMRRMR